MIARFAAAGLAAGLIALPAAAQDTPNALGEAFCAAVVAEDIEALGSLYTEDADSYGPDGGVVSGREAIMNSWAPFMEAYDDMTCALNEAGLVKSGKTATTWGLWTITGAPADGGDRMEMHGRFMDFAVKTKEGWRYRADHASMLGMADSPDE